MTQEEMMAHAAEVEEQERKLKEIEMKQKRLQQEEEELRRQELEQKRKMDEELQRQEEEKREIEKRLREKLKKQQEEEEKNLDNSGPLTVASSGKGEQFNDAPTYYQPTIIPQNPLNFEQTELYKAFIEKLTNPFTPIQELRDLYMLPVPPRIGQVRMTIERHKSGFNRLWPKYTLSLSEGNKFLLCGKKRSGNATSNYLITME